MSTNCLVTNLKSVVNNDNLKVLGQIKLLTEPTSGQSDPVVYIVATKNVIVKTTDSLRLNNCTEVTLVPNEINTLRISGNGYLIICDKYAISAIDYSRSNMNTPIDELKYMTALTSISCLYAVQGNIEDLLNYNPSITTIKFAGTGISGNFENIAKSKLEQLSTIRLESPYIKGNIDVFTNGLLTDIYLNDCINIIGNINVLPNKQNITHLEIYNTGISGSLDEYVASAISSGKTTAENFSITGAISQLTFGGNKQSIEGISTVAPCFVSWDSTGKISVKTGSYDVNTTTHVFCKGYTQSEAEAAFPGKTIIRVDA